MVERHVVRVRYDGGPRHGGTVDLVITDRVPLVLSARQDGGGDPGGLYELRSTDGQGTRYAWIEDFPVRAALTPQSGASAVAEPPTG